MTVPMDVEMMKVQQENATLKDALNVAQTRVQSYAQTANELLSANIELKTGVTLLQKQARDAMEGKKLVEKELESAMKKIAELESARPVACEVSDEMDQAANG